MKQAHSQNTVEIQGNLFLYADNELAFRESTRAQTEPLNKAVNSVVEFFCGNEVRFDAATRPAGDLF